MTTATEPATTMPDLKPALAPRVRRARPHSLFDHTLAELEEWLRERGHPVFRATQVFNWVYRHHVTDYGRMRNLPLEVRDLLATELPLAALTAVQEIETDDGDTLKVLYRTADGQTLETVLMFYRDRATVCVSCQVGCAVGCSFCATGMMGLMRNLSAGEMVAQVVDMALRARERDRPLTNVVMMGMGEPFHNYDAVMKMVSILHEPQGMHIGARRITVSTSGVVPMIDRLADAAHQVNLAISIHAGTDQLRSQLVPLNRRWPLDDLIAAIRRYIERTGRRVSFEYAMLSGVNTSDDDARQLARRLKGLLCHVNLIPYNPTPTAPYERPGPAMIERFAAIIRDAGIPVTVRYSRGVEIAAACGQLHVEHAARKRESSNEAVSST
jgi:23S rRNA (adenine2503-C2)-methyltransferase